MADKTGQMSETNSTQSMANGDKVLQLLLQTMSSREDELLPSPKRISPQSQQMEQESAPIQSNNEDNRISSPTIATDSDSHNKCPHGNSSSLGPPPRPFKKARYAWEIKNYEHTVENMSRDGGEAGCHTHTGQNILDIGNEENSFVALRRCAGPKHGNVDFHAQHFMPSHTLVHPSHAHSDRYNLSGSRTVHQYPIPDLGGRRPTMTPRDPDAGLFKWHTRQLCRSIFDNAVNRMLENMGFSPVTEQTQGIHPLLVLSYSDEEEREAEEAQHRNLETEALTAAMHQKGLLIPPYNYEPPESGTTTDYDSSEEDSELGDEAVMHEDLSSSEISNQHHHNHHHHHFFNRPMPVRINDQVINNFKREHIPAKKENEENLACENIPLNVENPVEECNVDIPNEAEDSKPINVCIESPSLRSPDIDDSREISDSEEMPSSISNTSVEEKVYDNKNSIDSITENTIEAYRKEDSPEKELQIKNEQMKNETEGNNNDKFFLDQAIQMAIKQQGLGYQQA